MCVKHRKIRLWSNKDQQYVSQATCCLNKQKCFHLSNIQQRIGFRRELKLSILAGGCKHRANTSVVDVVVGAVNYVCMYFALLEYRIYIKKKSIGPSSLSHVITNKMTGSEGLEIQCVRARSHGHRHEVKNQAHREQTAFQDWATAICLWSNTKKQHVHCPLEAFSTAIPFIFSACYFCDAQHTVSTNMYNQSYCCPQDTFVLDFSHFVNP